MTTLALRNRNMIDSLFNDVFDDFFTGNTLTRPYMAPTNKTAQVINRDEDWQCFDCFLQQQEGRR